MSTDARYQIVVQNPFTKEEQNQSITAIDAVEEAARFNALKKFITDHLKLAKNSELVVRDLVIAEKLSYLIVQLYQPNDISTLVMKLEKFKEYLHQVDQFREVYEHVCQLPRPKPQLADDAQEMACKNCNRYYYVPGHVQTIEDYRTYCRCPYCGSRDWEHKAQAEVRSFLPPPRKI